MGEALIGTPAIEVPVQATRDLGRIAIPEPAGSMMATVWAGRISTFPLSNPNQLLRKGNLTSRNPDVEFRIRTV